MLTPFFTIEPDCMPDARLRLLDAWEAWGVPHDQQLSWWVALFGVEEVGEKSPRSATGRKKGKPLGVNTFKRRWRGGYNGG